MDCDTKADTMSNEMDRGVANFLERIDVSLALIEAVKEDISSSGPSWPPDKYQQLVTNLRTLRKTIDSGKMPRPSRGDVPIGTVLSLRIPVSEWCENVKVLDSLKCIDDYYRYSF